MNELGIAFFLLNAALLIFLPRRWASLPLLVGACYMTLGQSIEVGPFTFYLLRMLIAVGFVRIMLRGEHLNGRFIKLDWLVVVLSIWTLISSFLHEQVLEALLFRSGLTYNICGIYFLVRIFCQSVEDLRGLCRIIVILLVPLAAEMLYEKFSRYNLFSVFGGVSPTPFIREGIVRAQGPFAHSILAGTVGSVSLPLAVGLWRNFRKGSIIGVAACLVLIFSSASSGPIMSAVASVAALLMWHVRNRMKMVRYLAVFGYIGLDLVMKAPAYYIIWRFNIAGGSTGYYRAALIDSAIQHINEWWLAGTDYTRHWMPTGVTWSEKHVDITNYYIYLGVTAGLPIIIIFISIIAKGFSYIGQALKEVDDNDKQSQFFYWTLGSSLFAHSVTCISVSYFDQSFIFIYMVLAAIGSMWSATNTGRATVDNEKTKELLSFGENEYQSFNDNP